MNMLGGSAIYGTHRAMIFTSKGIGLFLLGLGSVVRSIGNSVEKTSTLKPIAIPVAFSGVRVRDADVVVLVHVDDLLFVRDRAA